MAAPAIHSSDIALHVSGLTKTYGRDDRSVTTLVDVEFTLGSGETLTVLGPSGCGKSTLLRVLAGLDGEHEGSVNWPRPKEAAASRAAMVFQGDSLYPWLKIRSNVELPLRGTMSKEERRRRADQYLEIVGLQDFVDAYPHQVSGGMRQRAAIARALAVEPDVLLMDEPLAALDAQTRAVMQDELLRIWARTRSTVVYVTHDVHEALILGHRLFVMTARPARILREFHPAFRTEGRTVAEARTDSRLGELAAEIWDLLGSQVGGSLSSARKETQPCPQGAL